MAGIADSIRKFGHNMLNFYLGNEAPIQLASYNVPLLSQ